MARGLVEPSYDWRRDYSLVLGLERVLSDPQPRLASGTTLRRHQVDALAGQLAALISDLERSAAEDEDDDEAEPENGDDPESRLDDPEEEDDEDDDDEDDDEDDEEDDEDEDDDVDEDDGSDDPPELGHDPAMAVPVEDDADLNGDAPPPDPGARRRYRFKHPTASGKTIAAAGFVEAARTTGVLILTHRRLLVNQFTSDLTKEGYGQRFHAPVLRGDTSPRTAPLTINTYAWFIKHADQIKPDVYGVVVCDEAHTALGEKTAAAIRRYDEPIYIGMTATDQLLQKHVGDVFPAEVADFPLAEAVRRGVVAPLRCIRVRPIASLRQVEIVGGDFDQGQLAAALDIDPLNLAAADLYQSRFGDTPGIVYAAGLDHAERVAAAMRVIGMNARAVSGRTPPRELAETLAAYERGEINVLVNAQILAEGWNAPRATVCMHLAPTASRRVYQQRVGRIMRLHRRKEAGIVVDFAEVGAPHSERVVTLHSLLDVDAYRPAGLVTPPPPRRRRGRRKPPKPIVKELPWMVRLGQPRAPCGRDREPMEARRRLEAAPRRAAGMGGRGGPAADAGRRAHADRPHHQPGPRGASSSSSTPARPRTGIARCASPGSATWPPRDPARPPSRWPAGWSRRHPRGSRTAVGVRACSCLRWETPRSRPLPTGSCRGHGGWPVLPATTSTAMRAPTSTTAAACSVRSRTPRPTPSTRRPACALRRSRRRRRSRPEPRCSRWPRPAGARPVSASSR